MLTAVIAVAYAALMVVVIGGVERLLDRSGDRGDVRTNRDRLTVLSHRVSAGGPGQLISLGEWRGHDISVWIDAPAPGTVSIVGVWDHAAHESWFAAA